MVAVLMAGIVPENFCFTTYIDDKEFEDSFDSSLIADALNQDFSLEGGRLWEAEAIQNLKNASTQFSKYLIALVRHNCEKRLRSNVSKPSIAWAVAQRCTEETIPSKLHEALLFLRSRVGVYIEEVAFSATAGK